MPQLTLGVGFLDTLHVNVTGDTMTGDLNMSLKEILSFKMENVNSLPSSGNLGRVLYLTTDSHLYLDQG